MNQIVLSRQIDPMVDRSTFHFGGLPQDCEAVANTADAHGWIVEDSGVGSGLGGGSAWVTLKKGRNNATLFRELLSALQHGSAVGRLAPDDLR